VQIWDIKDKNQTVARLYLDLEARENKRGGAWMHNWESYFIDSKDSTHLPSAFVVANFPKASKNYPSLLRHSDVVTLFHEMGHTIHHLFSRVKERSLSGVNGITWDTVEFPSQFLENFAFEEAILERFAYHYESGKKMPKELIRKIKESKNFFWAMGMLRQLEFALFDFTLHQRLYQGDEVQELLDTIRDKVAVIKPPSYNKFQNGFSHIFAGGYAAGYYSYKWAEVFSADAFFECLGEGGEFKKDRALGYLEHILKRGSSDSMSNLYREWLGRTPDVKSLIKLYKF
jgi:oligopeptidase A